MSAILDSQGQAIQAPAIPDNSSALQVMIERLSRDGNVAALKELLSMQEQMHDKREAKRAETAWYAAMAACQADMGPINKDARNDQTGSKYATYSQIDEAIRPIYTKHGFALTYDEAMESPKEGHLRVLCLVTHCEGHAREYHTDQPCSNLGPKGGVISMNANQAVGSAKSYGQRYIAVGVFNLALLTDDDGNAASAQPEAPKDKEGYELVASGKHEGKRWADMDDGFINWCLTSEKAPGRMKEAAQREKDQRNPQRQEAPAPLPRKDDPTPKGPAPAQAPEPQEEPIPLAAHEQKIPGHRKGKRWCDVSVSWLESVAAHENYSQATRDGARAELERRAPKGAPDAGAAPGASTEAQAPEPPEGYATLWKKNMQANAAEGRKVLEKTWRESGNNFKSHAMKWDEAWVKSLFRLADAKDRADKAAEAQKERAPVGGAS